MGLVQQSLSEALPSGCLERNGEYLGFLASSLLIQIWLLGPYAVENIGCCYGRTLKLMAVLRRLRQAKWKYKMRWVGLRRYHDFFFSFSFFTSSSQLVKKYERGDLPKSDWLDKLTFRKMEEIHAVRWLTEISASCVTFIDRPRQRNQKTSSFTLIYPVLIFL